MPNLVVTWLAYTACYLLRKSAPVVKTVFGASFASADCSFLVCYAAGQLFCMSWVANVQPRRVIALGLGASALCCALAPTIIELSTVAFVVLWGIFGFCQAFIHPTIIRLLGPDLDGDPNCGFWMSVWCTSQCVGGVLGNLLAGYMLSNFGWGAAFLAPVGPAVLVVMLVLAHEHCSSVCIPSKMEGHMTSKARSSDKQRANTKGTLELLLFPGVLRLAMSYFLVKLVRYVLLLWLPFYNHAALNQGHLVAAGLATAFEVGGTLGTVLFGCISDLEMVKSFVGKGGQARINLCATFLVACGGFTALYPTAARLPFQIFGYCTMLIIGILVAGPEAAMSSSMLLDMSGADALTPEDLGQLAGIINGLGIVGATCTGMVALCGTEFFGALAASAVLAGMVLKFEHNGQHKKGLIIAGILLSVTLFALGSLHRLRTPSAARGMQEL